MHPPRPEKDRKHVIVEKDGIPMVVILSVPEYEQLLKELKLARFEQTSRVVDLEAEQQGFTEEQLEQEMEAIKERLLGHLFLPRPSTGASDLLGNPAHFLGKRMVRVAQAEDIAAAQTNHLFVEGQDAGHRRVVGDLHLFP